MPAGCPSPRLRLARSILRMRATRHALRRGAASAQAPGAQQVGCWAGLQAAPAWPRTRAAQVRLSAAAPAKHAGGRDRLSQSRAAPQAATNGPFASRHRRLRFGHARFGLAASEGRGDAGRNPCADRVVLRVAAGVDCATKSSLQGRPRVAEASRSGACCTRGASLRRLRGMKRMRLSGSLVPPVPRTRVTGQACASQGGHAGDTLEPGLICWANLKHSLHTAGIGPVGRPREAPSVGGRGARPS